MNIFIKMYRPLLYLVSYKAELAMCEDGFNICVLTSFLMELHGQGDPTLQNLVLFYNGVTYMFIQHNNIYLMAASRQNANEASLLLFLHRVVDVSSTIYTSHSQFISCLRLYFQLLNGTLHLGNLLNLQSQGFQCMHIILLFVAIACIFRCYYSNQELLMFLFVFCYDQCVAITDSHVNFRFSFGLSCVLFLQVFKHYFEELEEESLRDNFVIVVSVHIYF